MAGYNPKIWHKVTEKPDDYTDVVVIFIPPREYAAAAFGRYVA